MEGSLKGVILAGGTGSRLHPLTLITNKHLLPIYDRPMIAYAIEALVNAGVSELMLVTGGTHAGEFFRLLGNGHEHGIDRLFYAYQDKPGGIAEALGLAERFGRGGRIVVMLADNVVEQTLEPSGRGELEITDVNNWYVREGQMEYDVLEGFWGDAGESIDAYYEVNDFVRANGANKEWSKASS